MHTKISQTIKKADKYKDFDTYKSDLLKIKKKDIQKITCLCDVSLLTNKTFEDHIAFINKHRSNIKTEANKDFRDVSRLKKHISFRKSNNSFKYSISKDKKDRDMIVHSAFVN